MQKPKKNSSKTLKTSMTKTVKRRNDALMARRIVLFGVIISSLMVVISIIITTFFNPEAIAKRKFEKLATEYYETYYHEKFVENIDENLVAEKMETFSQSGLQPVTLRQLLLYQNGKNQKYKKYFETKGFACDKNTTTAKFFPVAPYGKTDYTVEYNYSCQYE